MKPSSFLGNLYGQENGSQEIDWHNLGQRAGDLFHYLTRPRRKIYTISKWSPLEENNSSSYRGTRGLHNEPNLVILARSLISVDEESAPGAWVEQ